MAIQAHIDHLPPSFEVEVETRVSTYIKTWDETRPSPRATSKARNGLKMKLMSYLRSLSYMSRHPIVPSHQSQRCPILPESRLRPLVRRG